MKGGVKIKTTRTEQTQINKNHPYYKVIDEYCFRSKNLYNYTNYILRQEFIKNGKYINNHDLAKELKTHEPYKKLMSQASQCTLQVLDRAWKSFFKAIKSWKSNPSKFLAKPKIPNYKKRDGRFIWFLKNNQTYIKDGRLYFKLRLFGGESGYSFKTNVKDRLISVRFVPKGSIYIMEIIYEVETNDASELNERESNRICSIDLGVNNFVTIVNNIGNSPIIINGKGIKSINQYWNKRKAKIQSELLKRNNKFWSKKLSSLNLKRNNKVKNYIHHVSKYIINYCLSNNIDALVVGLNKTWKQESKLNDKTNQNFIYLPHSLLVKQLKYKCQDNNIKLIVHEESYTSGTSFLDNETPCKENYNKKRRKHRGLFISNNGKSINADVNGAFQIMKKVFSKVKADEIKGSLVPTIINVVKMT